MSASAQTGVAPAPPDGLGSPGSLGVVDGVDDGVLDEAEGIGDAKVGDGCWLTVTAVLRWLAESDLPGPPHEKAKTRMIAINPAATIARRRQ
jgi:hypothetical protein